MKNIFAVHLICLKTHWGT